MSSVKESTVQPLQAYCKSSLHRVFCNVASFVCAGLYFQVNFVQIKTKMTLDCYKIIISSKTKHNQKVYSFIITDPIAGQYEI